MSKELQIGKRRIEWPILQGAMSLGGSTERLASAVTNEGGAGTIGGSGLGYPEYMKEHKLPFDKEHFDIALLFH